MPETHSEAGPSRGHKDKLELASEGENNHDDRSDADDGSEAEQDDGNDSPLKPLTPEALAAFKAAQERTGIIYISRIPPGMQPAKVRHLMSAYGEIGRVYLQQEDAKRAYLRRKFTSTKKAHYTEGWVEFKDKKIARTVAEMLNAQPIGGKKGTRWRDDIWTIKYLPKFKWNMLTEQFVHEAAVHRAKLRVELSQSKAEQQQYLKNVDLARVLEKRVAKKREKGEVFDLKPNPLPTKKRRLNADDESTSQREQSRGNSTQLDSMLSSIF